MDVASFSAQLQELQARAVSHPSTSADSPEALDAIESGMLGRKGELRSLLAWYRRSRPRTGPRSAPSPTPSARPSKARSPERRVGLEAEALDGAPGREGEDVTLPGRSAVAWLAASAARDRA